MPTQQRPQGTGRARVRNPPVRPNRTPWPPRSSDKRAEREPGRNTMPGAVCQGTWSLTNFPWPLCFHLRCSSSGLHFCHARRPAKHAGFPITSTASRREGGRDGETQTEREGGGGREGRRDTEEEAGVGRVPPLPSPTGLPADSLSPRHTWARRPLREGRSRLSQGWTDPRPSVPACGSHYREPTICQFLFS